MTRKEKDNSYELGRYINMKHGLDIEPPRFQIILTLGDKGVDWKTSDNIRRFNQSICKNAKNLG